MNSLTRVTLIFLFTHLVNNVSNCSTTSTFSVKLFSLNKDSYNDKI